MIFLNDIFIFNQEVREFILLKIQN